MKPLSDGLTEADLTKIRGLQAEKMKDGQGHCEMCGVNNWHISDHLWTPIMCKYSPTGIGADIATMYPMVTMICLHCGNTKFLHAKQLGFNKLTAEDAGGD
jgi:hypothetical protein